MTFSIWGVIYLLLGLHVLYQLGLFQGGAHSDAAAVLLNRIGVPFAISSLANIAWVFAWHYDVIWLSVVLIVTIVVCLVLIAGMLRNANLTVRQRWLVGVPFSADSAGHQWRESRE